MALREGNVSIENNIENRDVYTVQYIIIYTVNNNYFIEMAIWIIKLYVIYNKL